VINAGNAPRTLTEMRENMKVMGGKSRRLGKWAWHREIKKTIFSQEKGMATP
jgi:hypothetical protein